MGMVHLEYHCKAWDQVCKSWWSTRRMTVVSIVLVFPILHIIWDVLVIAFFLVYYFPTQILWWENQFWKYNGNRATVCVEDGIHFTIFEPSPWAFCKDWTSHKLGGAALLYELLTCIATGDIVAYNNGPFPAAGKWNDIKIFRNKTKWQLRGSWMGTWWSSWLHGWQEDSYQGWCSRLTALLCYGLCPRQTRNSQPSRTAAKGGSEWCI